MALLSEGAPLPRKHRWLSRLRLGPTMSGLLGSQGTPWAMSLPRFIVFESTSQWTVAMRWGLADSKIWVHRTESLESCLAMLEDAAGSVVAMEVAVLGVEATLRTIRDIRQTFPSTSVIALADSTRTHDALFRESGAVHVVGSRREVRSAARLVQRCLHHAETRPASYRAEVWNRMPWGNRTSLQPAVD